MVDVLRSIEEGDLHCKAWTAMRGNKWEELRMLLSKDAAKELIVRSGGNVLSRCLHCAVGHRNIECIEELLKAGANPRIVGHYNPVVRTIRRGGDVRILKLLLEYGASPDTNNSLESFKPLYITAQFGDFGCFRLLLLYGADPDYNCLHRNISSGTPDAPSVLAMCLRNSFEAPFVELLIQFGANIYLPDIQKVLRRIDNDATKLLDREKDHPKCLMSQCRIAIRRLLKQVGKLRLIDQLDVPDCLLKYLQYQNEPIYPKTFPRSCGPNE